MVHVLAEMKYLNCPSVDSGLGFVHRRAASRMPLVYPPALAFSAVLVLTTSSEDITIVIVTLSLHCCASKLRPPGSACPRMQQLVARILTTLWCNACASVRGMRLFLCVVGCSCWFRRVATGQND